MELPALIAVLVDAILIKCPQYDRVSVTVALESVFAGHPALLGGNTISMLFGQHNDFTNATITIGDVHAGNQVQVTVTLPQPIDPLPAALAALASIPLNDVPAPRSDLPQASRLPFGASPHFVGRESELNVLAQAIGTAKPAVVMPAVATGLGGIGKTSLVTEFAYRYGVYFHGGVFWLNCADPDQVASQIAACALDLGIDPTGMALDEQVQRVLNAWKSPMPRLLIFDNCEDRAILEQWKPTVGGCRVLVTARSDHWPTLTQIRLGLLSPGESRALLQRLCARLTDTEADLIATDLGHLPLALHLAGSYLNTYPHHTVAQYRTELTIAHQSLKGRGALPSPTRHEQDVEATFMLSFNQLDPTTALDAVALGMLDGAAWCAPGVPIPRDLVLAFVPDGAESDDAVDALRRLQQLGLLDGVDAVVLHRLLAQVVQARLGSPETLAVVEAIINTVSANMNAAGSMHQILSLEPHLRHLLIRVWDNGDERTARLATSLGFFEDLRGSYRESQRLYEQALAICKVVLGHDNPETAASMNNLAMVLARQGLYQAASILYKQALNINIQLFGVDHQNTVSTVHNIASILELQGRYAEALTLYEQVFGITEQILGIYHPKTVQSMNNLASVLNHQGRYAEAQRLYEQALSIRKEILGKDSVNTAQSMNNLASVLSHQGHYEEAQRLYEQALSVYETVVGIHHPDTAKSMGNLASVLLVQRRYAEAQSLSEHALMIHEQLLGENHPDTATSISNLARILEYHGQYEQAQALYERVLAVRERALGGDHPDTLTAVNNLAIIFSRQGRYGESKALYERVLATQTTGDVKSLDTMKTLNNLAVLFSRQGRYEDAQPLYEKALSVYETILGPKHPDVVMLINNLATVMARQGLYKEAQTLYEKSLYIAQQMNDILAVANSQSYLGETLIAQSHADGFDWLIQAQQLCVDAGLTNNTKMIANTVTIWKAFLVLSGQLKEWSLGIRDVKDFTSLINTICNHVNIAIKLDDAIMRSWLADQVVILRRLPSLPIDGTHAFLGVLQAWLRNDQDRMVRLEAQLLPIFASTLRQMKTSYQ